MYSKGYSFVCGVLLAGRVPLLWWESSLIVASLFASEDPAPLKRHQAADRAESPDYVPVKDFKSHKSNSGSGSRQDSAVSDRAGGDAAHVLLEVHPASVVVVFTIKLLVSNLASGAVIGKGGETIAALRATSRAKISLTDSSPLLAERTVCYCGLWQLAFYYI